MVKFNSVSRLSSHQDVLMIGREEREKQQEEGEADVWPDTHAVS